MSSVAENLRSFKTPTQPNMLAAALWYARQGFCVFPLRPGTKKPALSKEDGGRGVYDLSLIHI